MCVTGTLEFQLQLSYQLKNTKIIDSLSGELSLVFVHVDQHNR